MTPWGLAGELDWKKGSSGLGLGRLVGILRCAQDDNFFSLLQDDASLCLQNSSFLCLVV